MPACGDQPPQLVLMRLCMYSAVPPGLRPLDSALTGRESGWCCFKHAYAIMCWYGDKQAPEYAQHCLSLVRIQVQPNVWVWCHRHASGTRPQAGEPRTQQQQHTKHIPIMHSSLEFKH